MPNTHFLNPTLDENLVLTCRLVEAQLGISPGRLNTYKAYPLADEHGIEHHYILTHPLIQFKADPAFAAELGKERIIDIFEPTVEGSGSYGRVYPVIRSISFHNDIPAFENKNYLIKELAISEHRLDKYNKPPAAIRAAHREQYIASYFLSSHYKVKEESHRVFLHMDRAAGVTLAHYRDQLTGRRFLSLACALLEQIPKQLQQTINHGKHIGKTIIHCDITTHNILADLKGEDWVLKLIDFGLAKAKRADGSYTSFKARGTRHHYDATMYRAKLNNEPIVFTGETDLYGLYNIIAELAGHRYRASKKISAEELLEDLDRPKLNDLFHRMGFTPEMRIELTGLIYGMLESNRSNRLTLAEAQEGFKKALTSILTSDTAEMREAPLDALKMQMRLPIKNTFEGIKNWLYAFSTLSTYLSEADQKELIDFSRREKINNYYAYLYLHFYHLLKDYDEAVVARLLIRHARLTVAIQQKAESFQNAWKTRYYELANNLRLQITENDAAWSEQIESFQELQLSIPAYAVD